MEAKSRDQGDNYEPNRTNLAYANDTYIDGSNNVDSPMKTFSATLNMSSEFAVGRPIPITGYARAGISELTKVQF